MDKLPAVVPPRQAVEASPAPPTKPSPLSTEQLKRLKVVTECAKKLFQRYPTSDYDNPKEALAAMVTALNGYSLGIVRFVTSDETGLQRTCTFPPRMAEIIKACGEAAAKLESINRFENWGRRTEPPLVRGPRPSMEEIEVRFGGRLLPEGFGTVDPIDSMRETMRDVREKPLTQGQIKAFYEHEHVGLHLTTEFGTRRSARVR